MATSNGNYNYVIMLLISFFFGKWFKCIYVVLTFWHVPCPEPVAWSWQRPAVSWVQRRTLLQPSWTTSAQPGWCVRWQRSSCHLCCCQAWWISLYVGFLIGTKTVKAKITSKLSGLGGGFFGLFALPPPVTFLDFLLFLQLVQVGNFFLLLPLQVTHDSLKKSQLRFFEGL